MRNPLLGAVPIEVGKADFPLTTPFPHFRFRHASSLS